MKIAVYLTRNFNFRDGVTHYVSEVMKHISDKDEISGFAFLALNHRKRKIKEQFKSLYPDLNVKLKKTVLLWEKLAGSCEYKMPFISQ